MTSFTPPSASATPAAPPLYQQHDLRTQPTTEPAAVTAFVLAVSSLLIPVIPALVALPLAAGARRNIAESNGHKSGKKLALAAQIISVATLVLFAIFVAAVLTTT